jgi:NAD(P)H dehydrogenase (quinone)
MAKVAIIYYSATGHTYLVAQAVEEGARQAGAETRLRRVRELAPDEVVAQNAAWKAHLEATSHVPLATLEDLEWADAYIFGTPTRYGAVAAPLKAFLDSTGPLWAQGKLANKAAAVFTGAQNPHGGQEATLLTVYNVLCHWGAILVPPGYTDPAVFAAGGNPYGVSFTASRETKVGEEVLSAARYLGGRVARVAAVLAENRARLTGGR